MLPILFVTGLPRSGTKLLRDLLNNHSLISIPTIETVLVPYLTNKFDIDADLSDPNVLQAVCEEFEQSPFYSSYAKRGIDIEAFSYFSQMNDLTWPVFFEVILKFYGPKQYSADMVVGDKTPGYIDHLELLYTLWPEAKVVHIVRDPRDCSHSAYQAWKKNIYRTAARWNRSMVKLHEVQKEHQFPIHTVYYEALITDPIETLQGICEYLQLPFEPGMEIPTRASENLGAATGSMAIVNTNIKKYRKKFSASQIKRLEEIALPGMQIHKYTADNAEIGSRELSDWEKKKFKLQDGYNSFRFHIQRRGFSEGLKHFLRIHKQNIR